jgi:hypothetical protein
VLYFSFGSILLFDIPKDLFNVFLEHVIISKYSLGRISSCSNNFSFDCFINHKIINISFDLIKGYTAEITDNIYYFSRLATKQILVEKDINIYRYKEVIKFSLISIKDI